MNLKYIKAWPFWNKLQENFYFFTILNFVEMYLPVSEPKTAPPGHRRIQ